VIGGGFSGVEAAGEMMELIERSLVFYPNTDHRSPLQMCPRAR
jgi:NADH dehydrogenase FAD-containing subunit